MRLGSRLCLVAASLSVACANSPTERADPTPAASATVAAAAEAPAKAPLSVVVFSSSEANGSVNSYLLHGETDALLIDAQLVESEAKRLVEFVKASGKTLRTIYVTHPHPDHFMGLKQLSAAFPEAKILARPEVGAGMPTLYEKYKAPLQKFFPGDVADGVVTPEPFTGEALEVEGVQVRVLDFGPGEGGHMTAVHVPALRALFPSDMVYHRVHPWLNELRIEEVYAQIEAVRGMPDVDVVYPGHGAPMTKADVDGYKAYVDYVVARAKELKDGKALIDDVAKRYPDYKTMAGLRFTAPALVEHFQKRSP